VPTGRRVSRGELVPIAPKAQVAGDGESSAPVSMEHLSLASKEPGIAQPAIPGPSASIRRLEPAYGAVTWNGRDDLRVCRSSDTSSGRE